MTLFVREKGPDEASAELILKNHKKQRSGARRPEKRPDPLSPWRSVGPQDRRQGQSARVGLHPQQDRLVQEHGRAVLLELREVGAQAGAAIPEGRILIDTENSFTYRESGIEGVILASRLTGLSPNLTSRFTPGTLISNYEVYEALERGIAVPFRKNDPERQRRVGELKAADGMSKL